MKYNPFKMWGSYAGAFPGLILIILNFISNGGNCDFAVCVNSKVPMYIFGGIVVGVGFLIGWGIHSLFRRFKG